MFRMPVLPIPDLAPEGCSTLYVLVPVPNTHESINWEDAKDEYRGYESSNKWPNSVLMMLQTIISETIVTPDDWGASDIYRGAVFNLAHNLNQMLWRKTTQSV